MRDCSRLRQCQSDSNVPEWGTRTCKLLGLFCRDGTQVSQIALVSDEHDHDVGVRVIPQLFQPSCDIIVCLVLADIVDEESADCPPVVGGGDGTISLLSCSIPYLRLDRFCVNLDGPSCELDADGGF